MAEDSILSRRMRRLVVMDRGEIAERSRQFLLARVDLLRYQFGHDFANAPREADSCIAPGQFFFTRDELPAICDLLKSEFPAQVEAIVSCAHRIRHHRFDLLGYENLDYGTPIDWHVDVVHGKRAPKTPWFKIRYLDFQQVGDAKITWELNRHQHIVILAKAYLLTGDEAFVAEVISQWRHWWEENPYPLGVNWASALEVSFRVQAWIWTFFLLQDCALFTNELKDRWMDRLLLSGRHINNYLSTYFSPNTHLLGEALALFCLGTLFPCRSTEKWREKGWSILIGEARKQVREDGFYFEQSTYYHVYALDMFLHARILAVRNGIPIPDEFDKQLRCMLEALLLLSRSGVPHMFGDDDGGRLFDGRRNRPVHLLDPLATGAIIYQRGDFKAVAESFPEETVWLLGANGVREWKALDGAEAHAQPAALSASGLYSMFEPEIKQQLLIGAGPPHANASGHRHADALGVSLIRNGRVLLRDSGTFEYVGPGRERSRLRSTGAHNTLRVDGRDQAEMMGPFSRAKFPPVRVDRWINGKYFDLFEGSHSGYSRPNSPITHRRQVVHPQDGLWLVRDIVEGEGEHEVEIAWHLGDGLTPVQETNFSFSDGVQSLALLTNESLEWSRTIRESAWSPIYGRLEPALVVVFAARRELPADFVTTVVAGDCKVNRGRLVKIGDPLRNRPLAYRYIDERRELTFVFANTNSDWQLGAWTCDATFLCVSNDHENQVQELVLCDATFLDVDENRILSCAQRVSHVELRISKDATTVFSSDPKVVNLEQPLDKLWPEAEVLATKKNQ
jgi:Heparinase II/III-like protein/Heparinase II/III N-terminus